MRLIHLSDLHLGYRQYQRLTPGGINQREADVAATFRTAIDRVIALRPDAIVVAGDVFHSVRPTNQAILHAFLQFSRLRQSLPDAAIVLVAGNHDVPRTPKPAGFFSCSRRSGSTSSIVSRSGSRFRSTISRSSRFPAVRFRSRRSISIRRRASTCSSRTVSCPTSFRRSPAMSR